MAHNEHDSAENIPSDIATAWGIPEKTKKGPKPALSLTQIVRTAIAIAETEGLAAVSMGHVASKLGTGPMSLYRYVQSKDELLALMVDIGLGMPPAMDSQTGWRQGLAQWTKEVRARYYQHAWALLIPISGPPLLPNQVAWMEMGLRLLGDTALAESEKISIITLLSGYARNEATLMTSVRVARSAAGSTPDVSLRDYRRILAQVADPLRFPALHRVLAAGTFDAADDPDREFDFGLARILDGIESLIQRRTV
jgi:AcrR family transcriptional regulator